MWSPVTAITVPYMYDLQKFYPYNTVLIDHGDPSINTAVDLPSVLLLVDNTLLYSQFLQRRQRINPVYNGIHVRISFPRSRLLSVLDWTQVPLLPHILERD
ncbi:unnamed protein product [Brassica oleracea var. botrytis]